jgi:hypothetical protein
MISALPQSTTIVFNTASCSGNLSKLKPCSLAYNNLIEC